MDYYGLQEYHSGGLFQGSPPTSTMSLTGSFQTSEGEATVPDTANLLTSSVLLANSMECISTTTECTMDAEQWAPVTCTSAQFHDSYLQQISPVTLVTPPPEMEARAFPPMYPYTWHQPAPQYGAPVPVSGPLPVSDYLHGSSLDDSPLSSPGSCDSSSGLPETSQNMFSSDVYGQTSAVPTQSRSRSPLVDHVYGISASTQSNGMMGADTLGYVLSGCGSTAGYGTSCSMVTVATASHDGMDTSMDIPKGVKMPQRKGGIQLWQFLYSLLTDPGKKYSDIIEWTSNIREREFRMLEPEAIAIWWGHHKNKPNMSYDKFSRSLRYYYDKGILKKIQGERYVYRFLTDPEQMYRHIGTSDSRPKLKPMPQAAKVAMTKYQKEQNLDFTSSNAPIVTPAPEPLATSEPNTSTGSMVNITSSMCSNTPPPPYSYATSSNTLSVAGRQCSASTGNLVAEQGIDSSSGSIPMKRSRSLDSAYEKRSQGLSTTSHSLPGGDYDYFSSTRLSASPESNHNYGSNSIPTSQVFTSKVGYGYDSYIANQIDAYPIVTSNSTNYYTPQQSHYSNYVTPVSNSY